jgi:CRISPR-associated endonuclease/helicase Cas3
VFGTADLQADLAARKAAGLPGGLRHEIASVAALVEALRNGGIDEMPENVDIELALHLVATHHGLGRPLPKVPSLWVSGSRRESSRRPPAAGPREFAVVAALISATVSPDGAEGWDNGAWLRRFFAIIDRYGPWGSAYLEAMLILADRTVSADGG